MVEISWSTLMPLLPELFIAISGLILLVLGVFRGNEGAESITWAVIGTFMIAAVFLLGLDWHDPQIVLNNMFIMDTYGSFMKFIVLLGLMAALALSSNYLRHEGLARFEYPILVLFAGLGMFIMLSAHNMLSLYMGLELQSLSLYVLAAFHRDHIKSAEAGVKYFILGAIASGMLLFGISFIYGFTGTLSFSGISDVIHVSETMNPGLIVGMIFLLAGLAFKISAVPFHMWTPDVYEGAPTSVTALFAIVPKVAAIGLLMRVLFEPFGGAVVEWQQVIWFLAAASSIVGSFGALRQTNIKRLLAYSSIGNMGYALIGIASGTIEGAGAVILFVSIYMIMTTGAFGIILLMRNEDTIYENIEDLAGFSRINPFAAYVMAFVMFSMSGIPPLAGFFGKFFIFEAAIEAELYILAIIGILTSVVAAYYYLRVIKVMFFDEPSETFDKTQSFAHNVVVLISAAFILLFILFPATLSDAARGAAASLFAYG